MSPANCSFSQQALHEEITNRIAGILVQHLTIREFGGRAKTVIYSTYTENGKGM